MTIVSGFTFVSERESGPWIDCAPSAAAMVVGWRLRQSVDLRPNTDGGTAHTIRSAAGVPHSGGMDEDEIRRGVKAAFGFTLDAIPFDEQSVAAYLRGGGALITQLNYGELPSHLRRWSPNFTGGHSVALCGVNSGGKVGWFDPLATSGWSGEWVNLSHVWPAFWSGDFDGLKREVAMPGVQLTKPVAYSAKAVVRGSGHSYIRIWDGAMVGVPDGWTKKVEIIAYLDADYETPGASPAIPAGTKVVGFGDDFAVLLAQDVELSPPWP